MHAQRHELRYSVGIECSLYSNLPVWLPCHGPGYDGYGPVVTLLADRAFFDDAGHPRYRVLVHEMRVAHGRRGVLVLSLAITWSCTSSTYVNPELRRSTRLLTKDVRPGFGTPPVVTRWRHAEVRTSEMPVIKLKSILYHDYMITNMPLEERSGR